VSKVAFTPQQLALRSLRFHWRISVSIALGVAVATAVITGALLVGDSMRGSLRSLTEERLGAIDYAVFPGGFFDPSGWLAEDPAHTGVPIVFFSRGVVETSPVDDAATVDGTSPMAIRRAGAVQLIATDPAFWDLDTTGTRPQTMPGPNSVVLNAATAAELNVGIGDLVTIRLPKEQAVPADSPLGRDEAESEGLPRMTVVDVIPVQGLGRFSLSPSQAQPQNAYLSRELVTDILARPGQANVLLIGADQQATSLVEAEAAADRLEQSLQPRLGDYGLQLQHVQQIFEDEAVIDYYSLSSDRLLIAKEVQQAVTEELGEAQVHPLMTYLANKIVKVNEDGSTSGMVPYSTLTAMDSLADFPLDYTLPQSNGDDLASSGDDANVPAKTPLVLNDWAAKQLSAQVGDTLRVHYFEPESEGEGEVERTFEATLTAIVPITKPDKPYRRSRAAVFEQRPTVYNDPHLTPNVPGVTDQNSILEWNLPFQLERDLIGGDDDVYWNDYRLTPKAFIPLAAGRERFGSRFGDTTSLRIDATAAADLASLTQRLEQILNDQKAQLGFEVQPIRGQQMAASSGTTPFDVLFLLLSLFVIFAALLLITLLMRLGLLGRAKEYGTLLATGWQGSAATRLATREGLLAALPGAALGVLLGVGYAWTVLWALRTLWVGAVTVPFLQFHWSIVSLLAGLFGGVLIAWATIRLTARQLRRTPPRVLLAGQFGESNAALTGGSRRWLKPAAGGVVLISLLLGAMATQLSGQSQAGAFVGAGMLLLVGTLLSTYAYLQPSSEKTHASPLATGSLWSLAVSNARRNPLRSTLTIGLMAAACFLILSMSAFQLAPTDAGVGGFDLIGQTAQPYFRELSDATVQQELFGQQAAALSDTTVVAARVRPGQDASCNNLYKAAQPTVLGMPTRLADLYETKTLTPFAWAATERLPAETSPWRSLETPASGTSEDPVPMVLDQATAMWALQMYGGVGEVKSFEFDDGQTRHFKIAGLLSNSVLQGMVIIGEENFKNQFPQMSGDQYFLIHSPADETDTVAAMLENRMGDVGMDITSSRVALARLLAVQNTYLRTFQSLGALGLLLGTIGLAVAQLRNVLERRGELAVLRAVGFTRWRLGNSVLLEHAALLSAGIGCGLFAALLAVIPYALLGRAQLPIGEPLIWIAVIMLVGMLAGLVVLSRVLRMPLIASLRSQ